MSINNIDDAIRVAELIYKVAHNTQTSSLKSEVASLLLEYIRTPLTSSVLGQEIVLVASKDDLPTAIDGDHNLAAYATYIIITPNVDLLGDRLVGGQNTVIMGMTSENSQITSTGLSQGKALIKSTWTLPLLHFSIKNVHTALDIVGNINPPVALDWTGINFIDVPNIGTINGCDNFIFDKGSFLGSKGLIFSGTVGTIALNNSLFRGDGAEGSLISVTASCTITRRFRTIYSSMIAFGSTQAIDVSSSASIPTEGFILKTVNFSGSNQSQYLPDVDDQSNASLFTDCTGIRNTAVNGQLYMQGNATATVIGSQNVWYKVAGITLPSTDNAKISHSNNRLTIDAIIARKYEIDVKSLSFSSGNGNVVEFGFYDSELNDIRIPSRTKATANAAGRAENIGFGCVINGYAGKYVEIWCRNTSAASNVTVESMNFIMQEIK